MKSTRKFTETILVACGSLLLPLAAPAQAATNCPPLASKAVTATSFPSTSSGSFVNVSGTRINFVQGGSDAGCVLVSFSAEASADANQSMFVRAILDDVTSCTPTDTFFVRSNATATASAARAMNFVCSGVAPGTHSIRMQYRSLSGGTVSLGFRTMIVHYVP